MPPVQAFKRIRMTLARAPGFPEGSIRHGYEFIAPLDATGHIDADQWRSNRGLCTVHRFWADEAETGRLVHHGGPRGGSWGFHYGAEAGQDDMEESGYRFGAHAFTVGEYVSVKDEDGGMHTFQVSAITPV